jgi:hypothetical protein
MPTRPFHDADLFPRDEPWNFHLLPLSSGDNQEFRPPRIVSLTFPDFASPLHRINILPFHDPVYSTLFSPFHKYSLIPIPHFAGDSPLQVTATPRLLHFKSIVIPLFKAISG